MTLLAPLGLLGLLGVVVLIIIYLIKPNYQQKFISSTFVWKLSLKYRKKRIPFNKLRNIILIICQVLLLTACAMILAHPNQIIKTRISQPEVVVIIDSSASMRAFNDQEKTRYSRAVASASEMIEQTFANDGIVSVIMATDQPYYLVKRVYANDRASAEDKLTSLKNGEITCSYASSNLDEAISQCNEIRKINPDAKIYLYTDEYTSENNGRVPNGVTLVSIRDDEINGAILSASTLIEENSYTFFVDVACYGMDSEVEVCVDVYGANAVDSNSAGEQITFKKKVNCIGEETTKIMFVNEMLYLENKEIYDLVYGENLFVIPGDKKVTSYQSIHVSLLDETGFSFEDSFLEDNTFDIYGGQKQVIKVQYASEKPNSFWPAVLREARRVYSDLWDIQITQVKKGDEPKINGFDLYIFEHVMPSKMPDDGVLFLVNPNVLPVSLGVRIGEIVQSNNEIGYMLEEVEKHPIINNLLPQNITVTMFNQMVVGGEYETVLGVNQYSLLSVRNDDECKAVIMPFSLHYSSLPVTLEFPVLIYNTINYFFPATVEKNAYEVNEVVTLNARGQSLTVTGYEFSQQFEQFPATLKVSMPGTYTLKQTVFSGETITEKIFVKIPNKESNLSNEGEKLTDLYSYERIDDYFKDLLLLFAIALTALVFVEWLIRSHDSW